MSAIEDIEQRLVGPYSVEIGPEGDRVASIRLSEFRAALAEAWDMGREAGFDTGNEYGQGHEFPVSTDNPFKEGAARCNCGYGGYHEPENPLCDMNKGRP